MGRPISNIVTRVLTLALHHLGGNAMKSHLRSLVCCARFALFLTVLGFAGTPANAIDEPTTCEVRLWFDADFKNPSDPNNAGGNPPPGSRIMGTGTIAEPIFSTTTNEPDLDVYPMRVDDMNFLDGGDWEGFAGEVSSVEFRHYDQKNNVWVPGCDGWTAILYDRKDYQGQAVALTGSLSKLSTIGWNDRAASFKLIGPADYSTTSPPPGCTVELYEHHLSGDTWGGSSRLSPDTEVGGYGAGLISSIRFGGECGTTSVRLFDGQTSIDFSNADGPVHSLSEYGWNDRATSWVATFDVAPDPNPRGCTLRMFSEPEYTGLTWAVAGSQTKGAINDNRGAGIVSSVVFEGDCGDSEVIFYDGNNQTGNKAHVRVADGIKHPLWLSDWNDRPRSWTANFVSGPPVPTDPNLPVPNYVPCEVRFYDGIFADNFWRATTTQTNTGVFSSDQGAGQISSVEFLGAWCHDTFVQLYDVNPNQDQSVVPYVIKVADGQRHNLGAYGFDNKTQFWRVNFSDAPPSPSQVPDVVDLDYAKAEETLSRMFYKPVADRDWVMGVDVQGDDRTVHNKVLWTSYPSGAQLPAGTPLAPGSTVHYTKIIHRLGPPPPPPPPGPDVSFEVLPGRASDIGAGSGPIWVVDGNTVRTQFMQTWQQKSGVSATRIDIGHAFIWVVDQSGNVLYTDYGTWKNTPSGAIPAQDIGQGWGEVWVAGSAPPYDIQRFDDNKLVWAWDQPVSVPGGAKRIDVDLHGNPWIVNQNGQIHRHLIGGWGALPGLATDIGCGQNGDVWIVGTNPVPGGYEIFRWNEDIFDWVLIPDIGGVAVSVGGSGNPYIAADDGSIYKGTLNAPSPSPPPKSHPPVPDVTGMTTSAAIWAIENAGYVASQSGSVFTSDPGLFGTIESTSPAGGVPLGPGGTVSYVDRKEVGSYVLNGLSPAVLYRSDDAYVDEGLVVLDPDGHVIQTVYGDVSSVNANLPGIYTVPYVTTDEAGRTVVLAERKVIVEYREWHEAHNALAQDVAVGADGTVKIVNPDGRIFTRMDASSGWQEYHNMLAKQVAVDPEGRAWIVRESGQIFHQVDTGTGWQEAYNALAQDIAVGADGTVKIVHPDGRIFTRIDAGSGWQEHHNMLAKRIAVDPEGRAWIVRESGQIFHQVDTGTGWQEVHNILAKDIAVGADGTVWVVHPNGNAFVGTDAGWQQMSLSGRVARIAVDPNGTAWVVNEDGRIFQRAP